MKVDLLPIIFYMGSIWNSKYCQWAISFLCNGSVLMPPFRSLLYNLGSSYKDRFSKLVNPIFFGISLLHIACPYVLADLAVMYWLLHYPFQTGIECLISIKTIVWGSIFKIGQSDLLWNFSTSCWMSVCPCRFSCYILAVALSISNWDRRFNFN